MATSNCTFKKFLLELVLISHLAHVFSRSLPASNIPYQVVPLSIPYHFQGNPSLRTGYYNPQLSHAYQPPEPAGTFYDSKRGILRSFPGGGVPVLVDHYKRCSGNFLGIKPHPNQREYYYVCKPDCVIFGRCQNLQFFDGTKGQCSLYSTPEYTPVCTKPGRFPILSDCTIYYRCDAQLKPRMYSCPRNTVFSPRESKCICGTQCNPTEVSSHGSHIPLDCEHKFPPCLQDGTFRTPTDCSLYYTCVMQSKGIYLQTRFKCPELTFFDTAQKVCRPQHEVACDSIQLSELVYPRPPALPHLPVIYPPHYSLHSLEDSEYPAEYSMSCSKEDPYSSSVESRTADYHKQSPVTDSTSYTSSFVSSSLPDLESIEPESTESYEADTTSSASAHSSSFTSSPSYASTSISTLMSTDASLSTASSTEPTTSTTLPTTSAKQSTLQTFSSTDSSSTPATASSLIFVPSTTEEATPTASKAPTPTTTTFTLTPVSPSTAPSSIPNFTPSSSSTLSTVPSEVTTLNTTVPSNSTSPTAMSSIPMDSTSSASPRNSTLTTFTIPTSTLVQLSSSVSPSPASTTPINISTPSSMSTTTEDITTPASSLTPWSVWPTAPSATPTETVSSSGSTISTPFTLSSSSPTVTPTPYSSSTGETTVSSAQTTTVKPSTQSTRCTSDSIDLTQNEINPSETHDTNSNTNNSATNEIGSVRSHTPAEAIMAHKNNENTDYTDLSSHELVNVYSDEYDTDLGTTEISIESKSTEKVGNGTTEFVPDTSTDLTPQVPESGKQASKARNQDDLRTDSLDIEDMEAVKNELHTHKDSADVSYYEDDMESNEALPSTQKTTPSEEVISNSQAPVPTNGNPNLNDQLILRAETPELTHTIDTTTQKKLTDAELITSPTAIRQTGVNEEQPKTIFKLSNLDLSTEKLFSEALGNSTEKTNESTNSGDNAGAVTDIEQGITNSLVTHEKSKHANVASSLEALNGENSPETAEESNISNAELNLKSEENTMERSAKELDTKNLSNPKELTHDLSFKKDNEEHKLTNLDRTNTTTITTEWQPSKLTFQQGTNDEIHMVGVETNTENFVLTTVEKKNEHSKAPNTSLSPQNIEKVAQTADISNKSNSLENESLDQTQTSVDKPVAIGSHGGNSWNSQRSSDVPVNGSRSAEKHVGIENLSENQQSEAAKTANALDLFDTQTEPHTAFIDRAGLVVLPIQNKDIAIPHSTTEKLSSADDLNSINFWPPLTPTQPTTFEHESHTLKAIHESFEDATAIDNENAHIEEAHDTQVEPVETQLTTGALANETVEETSSHSFPNFENPIQNEGTPHLDTSAQGEIESSNLSKNSTDFMGSSKSLRLINLSTLRPMRQADESGKIDSETLKRLEIVAPSTVTATQIDRVFEMSTSNSNKIIKQSEDSAEHRAPQELVLSIEQDSMDAETADQIQRELETKNKELRNKVPTKSNENFENFDRSLSKGIEDESLDASLEESIGLIRVTTDSLQASVPTVNATPTQLQSASLVANESSPLSQDDHEFASVDSTMATGTSTVSNNTSSNAIHHTTTSDTNTTTPTPTTTAPHEVFATTAKSLDTTTAHTTQLDIHFQDKSVNIESNDVRVARNALQITQSMKSAYKQNQMTNTNSKTVAGYPADATDIPKMEIAVFGNLDLTVLFCPKDCSEIHEHKYDKSVFGDQHVVGVQWDPANSNKTMSLRTV